MAESNRPERLDDASPALSDADIVTRREGRRRRFLWSLSAGLMAFGAAAMTAQRSTSKKHDFPKGSSDNDVSKLADIKHQHSDRDENDFAFNDDDVSRLRDVRRSRDSD